MRRPLACKGRQACEALFSLILFPSPIGSKTSTLRRARSGVMDLDLYFLSFESPSLFKIIIMQ